MNRHMDPNAILANLRKQGIQILVALCAHKEPDVHDVNLFAVLFTDLDEWLSKGGALPEDWAR